jgi:hypothetical protein
MHLTIHLLLRCQLRTRLRSRCECSLTLLSLRNNYPLACIFLSLAFEAKFSTSNLVIVAIAITAL